MRHLRGTGEGREAQTREGTSPRSHSALPGPTVKAQLLSPQAVVFQLQFMTLLLMKRNKTSVRMRSLQWLKEFHLLI